jgi:hypothetical protein
MHGWHCASKIVIGFTSVLDHSEAMQQRFARIGYERWAQSADTVATTGGDDEANVLLAQMRRIEANAIAAVDLQIEQRRRNPARFDIYSVFSRTIQARDAALLADEIDSLAGCIMPGANAQGLGFHAHVEFSLALFEGEQSAKKRDNCAQQRSDAEYQHLTAAQTQSPDGFAFEGEGIRRHQLHVDLFNRLRGGLWSTRSASAF